MNSLPQHKHKYHGILTFNENTKTWVMKFKNDDTNDKFVTKKEYLQIIRDKKLKKLNELE